MARGSKTTTDGTQADLRRLAIGDLDTLIEVLTDLRGDLRSYQSGVERMRCKLIGGGRLYETPRLGDVVDARASVSGRLIDLEASRSRSRRSIWRLQLAEGMTLSEIARFWGFSRQLVSRTLNAAGALTNGKSRAN